MNLDSRIALLEERIAWFEKHATEQDRAMLRQSEEIKALQGALISMRERMTGRDMPLEASALLKRESGPVWFWSGAEEARPAREGVSSGLKT